jgi:hypothetical protein
VRAGKLFRAIVVLGASGAGTAAGCAGSRDGNHSSAGGSGSKSVAQPGSAGSGGTNESALYDGGSVVDDAGDPLSLAGFGATSEPEGVFWPTACDSAYQFVCDSYIPFAGCRCDTTRPRGPEDCGGVRMTRCSEHSVVDQSQPFDPNDPELGFVDCRCIPENASAPDECEGFGQFVCNLSRTVLRDCHCDSTRPATPEACAKPEDFFCSMLDGRDLTVADCRCDEGDTEADCQKDNYEFTCQSENPRYGCTCYYVGIK